MGGLDLHAAGLNARRAGRTQCATPGRTQCATPIVLPLRSARFRPGRQINIYESTTHHIFPVRFEPNRLERNP
jgi:hypothetical protein